MLSRDSRRGLPSHAYLAGAFVVIPAVIQKVDTPIYCRAHDSNRELLINVLQTKMPASQTDCRNFLAGASETSIDHHFTLLPSASISRTPGQDGLPPATDLAGGGTL